ncbi:tRNA epoxyqueuosine(34) reductase QueG [Planctomycetota bacterium]
MTLEQKIKRKAVELGFDLVGITDAAPLGTDQLNHFNEWLNAGFAAEMNYMSRNLEKRTNPAKLLASAKSIICLGLNYKPPQVQRRQSTTNQPTGRVSIYAQFEDYHKFIKSKLRSLVALLSSVSEMPVEFKICVDSVPIAERAFAQRAGLGFIAKNHMLINPTLGPQIFLAEIIINLQLKPDLPFFEQTPSSQNDLLCSHCSKCIDACPTGALQPGGRFNAAKCISYLTIEHKEPIPSELDRKIGDRLFGCDECVLACPYQHNAPVCKSKEFKFHPDRAGLDLHRILNMSGEEFDTEFADSPVKRITLQKLKSNAQACLKNITK